jgi:hypothetical protein
MPMLSSKQQYLFARLPIENPYEFASAWLVIQMSGHATPTQKSKSITYLAPRAALWISVGAFAIHLVLAAIWHSGTTFQRSGSIITMAAASLCRFGLVRCRKESSQLSGDRPSTPRLYEPAILLPVLAAVGTAIWGYGDLIKF